MTTLGLEDAPVISITGDTGFTPGPVPAASKRFGIGILVLATFLVESKAWVRKSARNRK